MEEITFEHFLYAAGGALTEEQVMDIIASIRGLPGQLRVRQC